MTYLVSPTDPSTPTDDQGATQGAEELRALKGYLAGLLGFPTGFNPFRKNAIINGDFPFWQRATSFVGIAAGAYSADRFLYQKSGTMVHDISRSTDIPTVAQAGRLFNYSLLVDCQTIDAAIAAGDFCFIEQPIEGYNFLPLAQVPMVLSFWVKATKTGIYCVAFRNSVNDRCYVSEYTVNVTDTWEKKTIAVPASPSAGTWDYTNGIGLRVTFALAAGSSVQGAAGAWQAANIIGTVNQVNACDNIANNFRITGIQLEPGTIATNFEQRSIIDETQLCRRYFLRAGLNVHATANGVGWLFRYPLTLPVNMRVTPTASILTVGFDTNTTSGPTPEGVSVDGAAIVTGGSAAAGAFAHGGYTYAFSAEL